ncbi:hypothetical protein [Spirillospora sp. CA-294931]|uniref:hypothetical protein n=1 Tax=Spirillospora sp. CA-294931 TaxID=3240042 RepID=UPI003D8D0FDD
MRGRVMGGVALGVVVLGTGTAAAAVPEWKIVHTVSQPVSVEKTLDDIVATGESDVWAVGTVDGNSEAGSPLVQRFDGTRWNDVEVPVEAKAGSRYRTIDASGPGDVWFFGNQGWADENGTGLAVRWDGTAWKSHRLGASTDVADAEVRGPNDVWVAGTRNAKPYTGHYDGSSWKYRATDISVAAVGASGADDVWFAGRKGDRAALERWDGRGYTRPALPAITINGRAARSEIQDVVAFRPGNVWAVGRAFLPGGADRPLALHWDGRAWSATVLPIDHESFGDIAADGSGGLWASGRDRMFRFTGGRWVNSSLKNTGEVSKAVTGITNVRGTTRSWASGTLRFEDPGTPLRGVVLAPAG